MLEKANATGGPKWMYLEVYSRMQAKSHGGGQNDY
jgi:hypothetical protein